MTTAPAVAPSIDLATYTVPAGHVLILRTCNSDLSSSHGFTWPKDGLAEAPDWRAEKECGHGLHGFLRGEGDHGLANWGVDAAWIVAEVEEATLIDLTGKVKFPRANVIYAGDRRTATDLVQRCYPGAVVLGGTATAGDRGTATAGDRGTATAGDRGTATAGYAGTATAGDRGTATAGDEGTATAGDRGTATAGDRGTATAGDAGCLVLRRWDGKRWRLVVGYVGEGDLVANTPYKLNDVGEIVPAKPVPATA